MNQFGNEGKEAILDDDGKEMPAISTSPNQHIDKLTKQRFFIEFSYKGTNYHGWQYQKNAHSVQAELERVLSIVFRQAIHTTGAGRTDTGVHARQMYAHFDAEFPTTGFRFATGKAQIEIEVDESAANKWHLNTENLLYSINMMLPYDVSAKSLIQVDRKAHTRFDATQRSYEYHINFQKDPFLKEFSYYMHFAPNMETMNDAAKLLFEYIDFSCFSRSRTQTHTNNCYITRAEWMETPTGMVFHISANRFLRNMVRAIVGTLLDLGLGKLDKEGFRRIILNKNRADAGQSVPACGLFLTKVVYPYI